MSRFFRRIGVTVKRLRRARAGSPRHQPPPQTMANLSGLIDPRRLVFIDETWTKTNMTRLRGWALKGERSSTRFLTAAGRPQLSSPPCATTASSALPVRWPINGERFHAYVEQFLVPTLKPVDLVILDNLGSHKGKAVRKAIWDVGARLVFLPKYSPTSTPSSRSSPSSNSAAKSRSAKLRGDLRRRRQNSCPVPARRMRRIHQERRIRVDPKAGRSSAARPSPQEGGGRHAARTDIPPRRPYNDGASLRSHNPRRRARAKSASFPPVLVPPPSGQGAGGRTRAQTSRLADRIMTARRSGQDPNATQGGASPRPCRPFSSRHSAFGREQTAERARPAGVLACRQVCGPHGGWKSHSRAILLVRCLAQEQNRRHRGWGSRRGVARALLQKRLSARAEATARATRWSRPGEPPRSSHPASPPLRRG